MGKREELAKLQRERGITVNTNDPNAIDMFLVDKNIDEFKIVPLIQLRGFKNHIFIPYDGDRLDELIESIKDNGILTPLIVRPIEGEIYLYEILAGHNRYNASSIIDLKEVPIIIKHGLTDEAAELITITTNLNQRAIESMLPSELGKALKRRNEILKQQGKRTDLTLDPMGQKLSSVNKISDEYKLSATNVKRYIRITNLNDDLLQLVDNNKIPFRSAVELSYLKINEMTQLYEIINRKKTNITIKMAEDLKRLSQGIVEDIDVKCILNKYNANTSSIENISINKSTKDKLKEIVPPNDFHKFNEILLIALRMYYSSKETSS